MKKKSFLHLVIMVILCHTVISHTMAQERDRITFGADIYSRFVWRGMDFGNSPAIQPWANYSNSGFTIGTWGSYATNSNNMQEVDILLSYDIRDFITLRVADYFVPDGLASGNNYFSYKEDTTAHVFEGTACFNGVEKFPLSLAVSYNFYGADPDNALYIELGYSRVIYDVDLNLFLGGGTGAYYLAEKSARNFGIINLGFGLCKKIRITEKFSLPVSTSLIVNPTAENIFLVAGLSIQ